MELHVLLTVVGHEPLVALSFAGCVMTTSSDWSALKPYLGTKQRAAITSCQSSKSRGRRQHEKGKRVTARENQDKGSMKRIKSDGKLKRKKSITKNKLTHPLFPSVPSFTDQHPPSFVSHSFIELASQWKKMPSLPIPLIVYLQPISVRIHESCLEEMKRAAAEIQRWEMLAQAKGK